MVRPLRCKCSPDEFLVHGYELNERLQDKFPPSNSPEIKPSRSHVHMCSRGSRDTVHAKIHIASVVLNWSDMHRVTSKINRLISFEMGENASHIFMGSSQRSCVHSNSISAQTHLSLLLKLDRCNTGRLCNMPSSPKNRDKTASNEKVIHIIY